MTKSCDCIVTLPNTDIFDPIKCVEEWNRCATDQQIHVYLNSQIQKTQQCLQSFVDGQNLVNSTLNTRSLDAIKRITAAEQEITRLDGIQTTLQENFRALSSGNNEFKLSTQQTLDLYQTSIDALTTANTKLTAAQEKLQADLSRLRNELDTDKINQALAGYDAILAEAKKLIAASEHEYSVKIQQLDTSFKNLDAELRNEIATHNAQNKKQIDEFRHEVQQQVTTINANLNAYIANTDKTITDFKTAVETKVRELSARIDATSENINQISGGMSAKVDALKSEFTEKLATEKAQRIDGDEQLKGNFNILNREVKEDIREFKNSVNGNIISVQNTFNERVNNLEKTLTVKHDADIKTLTDHVDEVETTLRDDYTSKIEKVVTQHNKDITHFNSELNLKFNTAETNTNNKITNLKVNFDADIKEIKEKIKLVDESSRGRDTAQDTLIGDLTNKVNNIVLDTDTLKAEIKGEISAHVDNLKAEIQGISDRVDNHLVECETIHTELKEQSNKQWTTLNNIEARYTELVAAINKIREQMENKTEREDITVRNLTESLKECGEYMQVGVNDNKKCIVVKPIDCNIIGLSYGAKWDEANNYYLINVSDDGAPAADMNCSFNIVSSENKVLTVSLMTSYIQKLVAATIYK